MPARDIRVAAATADRMTVLSPHDAWRIIGSRVPLGPADPAAQRPVLTTSDLRRIFRADRKTIFRMVELGKISATRGEDQRRWLFRPDVVCRALLDGTARRPGYGPLGPRAGGRWYTDEDLALIVSDRPARDVAAELGRSTRAIHIQRARLRKRTVEPSIPGRWFVTPHAVLRYTQRALGAAGLSYEQALAALIKLSVLAHLVRKERDGAELWRGPKPDRLRFIVGPPPKPGALPVLVTVKPEHGDGRCGRSA